MIILPILATAGLTLVLYLTGIFVVFTPLPLLLTIRKKGIGPAAIASVLAMAVLVLLYKAPQPLSFLPMMVFYPDLQLPVISALSLVYFFYYLSLGWIIAYVSDRSRQGIEATYVVMTLTALAFPVVALLLAAGGLGVDLAEQVSLGLNGLFKKMFELQGGAGLSGGEFADLREFAPVLVDRMMGILPAVWIDFTMIVLSLNILFLRKWGGERPLFRGWGDFSLWRLGEKWIWMPIGTGAIFFVNDYLLHLAFFGTLLTNILIVLGGIYFFQGLAIVSFFFRKRLSPLTRLLFYLAVFLFFQVVGVAIIAVGLFDFWFDFRKLKKVG